MRIVLLVKFGPEFIALVFALAESWRGDRLVDPGMGRKNLIQCLEQSQPMASLLFPWRM